MSLWPKEHGAYGQISFPLLTALIAAGVSPGGLLTTGAVVAGFVAHEPAAVLLGLRGPRARRELGARASHWLAWCTAAGLAAAVAALATTPASVRWSFAVPLVPAIVLGALMVKGREKSAGGEVAAALAFSGAALPVALAAGAPLQTALAIAIPFALLFATTTLAVRVVILRVRGGGDPRATRVTRVTAYALAGAAAAALVAATTARLLPVSVLVSAAPGLATAVVVAANPPSPARLRVLGWTLVTISLLTAAVVLTTA